jgi:hypothetical protein
MTELDEQIKNVCSIRAIVEAIPSIDFIDFEDIQPMTIVQDMWSVIKQTSSIFSGVAGLISSHDTVARNEIRDAEISDIFSLVNLSLGNMESRADIVETQLFKWLELGEEVANSQLRAATVRCIVHKILMCYNEVLKISVESSEKLCILLEQNRSNIYGSNTNIDLYS